MTRDEALNVADEWRVKFIGAQNTAAFWIKEADSIEKQRVIVFRELAIRTAELEAMEVGRNGWRLIALVQVGAFVAILLNTYVFGGGA